ncbi:MAG: hypothetical protein CM1200mP36_01570 [Gammaproteobacteria bacterium]|nr:MAG: hypothetical protein CM1200mP36_01570 [Gammaproteobacteria bacterium]
MHEFGRLPRRGEVLGFSGFRFRVHGPIGDEFIHSKLPRCRSVTPTNDFFETPRWCRATDVPHKLLTGPLQGCSCPLPTHRSISSGLHRSATLPCLCLERPDAVKALWTGFAFGLLAFSGVHWVYVSIHDFGSAHPFLAGQLRLR